MPEPISPIRLSRTLTRSSLSRSRGVLTASLVASAALALFGAGCRRNASPPVVYTNGTIRLNALLPLHPAWNDVRQIDALLAHARGLPAASSASMQAGASTLSVAEPALPAPLPPRVDTPLPGPPGLGQARAAGAGRIEDLRLAFRDHNDRVLDREATALEKRITADVAAERDRLAKLPPEVTMTPDERAERRALRNKQMERIALESQVRVLTVPALTEAEKRLAALLTEIRIAEAKLGPKQGGLNVNDAALERAVAEYRSKRMEDVRKSVDVRGAELNAKSGEVVAAYRKRMRDRIADATPPGRLAVRGTPGALHPRALPGLDLPSPAAVAAEAGQGTPGGGGVRISQEELSALLATRARIAQFVTDDLRRRLERISAKQLWRVTYTNVAQPGQNDLTGQASDLLKQDLAPPAGM